VFASKHCPNGTSPHLDNARLEALIAAHQTGADPGAMGEIVTLIQRRALALIRFNGTTRYCSEAELLSDVNFKVLKSVRGFDSSKGSGFTFVSCLVQNVLRTSVTKARLSAGRHVELDETATSKLVTNGETDSRDTLEDLSHRIKAGIRTTITDLRELGVQRWYVDSLIAGEFVLRRHQCANAAMSVYQVSHSRSRELYDLTVLEVRRLLYDELPRRQPIAPGRLAGTRAQWMARFQPLLSEAEFTKLFVLARDLSPFVILLVDPSNRNRRTDRSAPVTRRNLEFVINGHPDAVPLFALV
jgi:hypothetical protein